MYNRHYRIELWNDYLAKAAPEALADCPGFTAPSWRGASLWLSVTPIWARCRFRSNQGRHNEFPEPPPLDRVCHKQYPGRTDGIFLHRNFASKKAL
jgi:hypothetical protein